MLVLSLALCLFSGFLGTYLGIRAYKNFKRITQGDVSVGDIIATPIIAGGATTFTFLTIISIMGFLDQTYVWTISSLQRAILISLIPGSIVTLGAFVQALMVTGYRGILIDTLRKKDKEK